MDEIEHTTQAKPAKKPSTLKNIVWLVVGVFIVLVVSIGGFFGLKAYQNRNVWAKVGDYVISQNEFKQAQTDLKKTPYDIGVDTSQVKKEDKPAGPVLIFNAALKTEANKQNIQYTDQDLNTFIKQGGQYKQYKDLPAYFAGMQKQNSWSESTARKVLEINYLQPKLAQKMLATKNYEAIIIRWDNLRLATSDVKITEDAVALRMKNEYLPQFQNGANSDQIAKSADVSLLKSEADNNRVLRNNPVAFSAFKTYEGISDENLETMFQNYPEGTKNSVELRKLKKVGEYTPVFKSATGYYAIFRLESINAGAYESYQGLFDAYLPKLAELSFVPNVSKIDVLALLTKALYSITPHAEAAGDCLSGHRIAFHTHWIDQDTGAEIGGGSINANSVRNQNYCDPAYYSNRDGQEWSHGGVQGDGFYAVGTNRNFGSGYEIFNLDCNGPTWNFNFTAPGGYDLGQQPLDPGRFPGFGQFARTENGSWLFPGVINSSAWTMPSWYYAGTNGETWEIKIYIKRKPTYLGTLSVQKYSPPSHSLGTNSPPPIPDEVKNATIHFSNDNGEFTSGTGDGSNSVVNSLWVDWLNPYNNGWRANGYRVTADAPPGYRVARWEIQSNLGTPYPNRYGGTGNTVGGIQVVNGGTVWVDFFYEKLADGNLDGCRRDANNAFVLNGWAMDLIRSSQAINVHIYDGDANGPTTYLGQYLANGVGRANESFGGVSLDGHLFDATLPVNSGNHVFRAYAISINESGGLTGANVFIGQKNSNECGPSQYTGTLSTKKFFPANHSTDINAAPAIPDVIKNAKVTYSNTGGWFTNGTSNPYNFTLWVNPFNINSNAAGPYTATVEVPSGYRVARHEIVSLNQNSPYYVRQIVNSNENTVTNILMNANSAVYLDFFFELIPPPPPVNYPWLQTKNGDVTSVNGTVWGQALGLPGSDHLTDSNPGARRKNSVPAEADYVISAALAGKDFCSNNLYTLGQNLDRRQDCKTGGYVSGQLDPSDPSKSLGLVDFDQITNALQNVWDKNGAGTTNTCKPYATANANPVNPTASNVLTFSSAINLGCTTGGYAGLQRSTLATPVALGTPGTTITLTGRGTLWVAGDLTINSNIEYGPAGTEAQKMPNLVIFVEGDVKIDERVTQIDASIVTLKSINSCVIQAGGTSQNCKLPLVNNGYWASDNRTASTAGPIRFSRRHYNVANANTSPAELLRLTGQSIIFPPPGLNKGDGNIDSQLQIDPTELQPRLN